MVVLLFMFALASITQGFQNEPDGFRGLEWGDPPGEDMILLGKDYINPDSLWYKRTLDKRKIGRAELLEEIRYVFYKNQFFRVRIRTHTTSSRPTYYDYLKDVLILKFGRGEWMEPITRWYGKTAIVELERVATKFGPREEGPGELNIYSTEIYLQKEQDEKKKAEEEARQREEEHWSINDLEAAKEGLTDFNYIPTPIEEERNEEPVEFPEKQRGSWQAIEFQGPITGRSIEKYIEPEYPEWSEKQDIERAIVALKLWVLPSGEVVEIEIIQTSGVPEFDRDASQALMKWRFEEIEEEEKQWGIITFRFEAE